MTQTPRHTGDEVLIRAVAKGDRDALRELVMRHEQAIRRLARHMLRDADAADDAAQDVFLRVYFAAGQFQPTGAFRSWLYQIATNLCRDRLRQRKRRPTSLDAAGVDPVAPPTPDPLDAQARTARVRRAIDRLPSRQRQVALLHRYEGLAHTEIAAATGWSQSAVESLLVRAYARLRRELADLK